MPDDDPAPNARPMFLGPLDVMRHIGNGLRLANYWCVSDIETNCVRCRPEGSGVDWFDTRPMIDPREHSPELIDMAMLTLQFAEESGLIQRHADLRYLVRLTYAARAM